MYAQLSLEDDITFVETLFRIVHKYKEQQEYEKLVFNAFEIIQKLRLVLKENIFEKIVQELLFFMRFYLNSSKIFTSVVQSLHVVCAYNSRAWYANAELKNKAIKLLHLAIDVGIKQGFWLT